MQPFNIEFTVLASRNGIERRMVIIHSKLYPFILTSETTLQRFENVKHFKELEIKSGSSHLWVKPFFNSEILLISLQCSMVFVFGNFANILIFKYLAKYSCCFSYYFLLIFNYLSNCETSVNKTTKGHLSILNLPKGTTAKYVSIPNHNKLNSIAPATLFTKSDKAVYALLPHNDTVYKIIMQDGSPKIESHIKIDFHGDFLDYSKWPNRGFTDEEFAKIINHKELIYNINSFYSASGKLFFKTQGKTNKFFMIELSTKDIYQFNYLFEGLHPKTSATSIIGSSSDELYFIFNKSDLINHYKKRKSPTKIPAIANLLNNPNDFHDTILILCKIKQYENPN